MAVGEFQASLIDSHELAPGVRHFVFEAPEPLEYAPGQFVSLHAEVDGKPVKRAYSIASPPRGSRFALCLNRVCEGVFSPHLFDLQPGAKVKMKGPYGVFGWREPVNDSVLVATGTGIAPFRAMLQGRVPEDPGHRFTLVFGVREERGVLYRVEFERLAARCPGFRFWPTLTPAGAVVEGPHGPRATAPGGSRGRAPRHRRVHLRSAGNGGGRARRARPDGIRAPARDLRAVRLTGIA